MEDRGNQGGEALTLAVLRKKIEGLSFGLLLGVGLAGLSLLLSLSVPRLLTADYDQKSLSRLKRQSRLIRKEFAGLLKDQNQKLRRAAGQRWPEDTESQFNLLKNLGLDSGIEGIASYAQDGRLRLWYGNVLNLEEAVPGGISDAVIQQFGQTLLVKDKASSYLVSLYWVDAETLLVLYRIVAFIPQFKSPYLSDYHFLKPGLLNNSAIDYYDFREDNSGFEKIFSRHGDEYIGEPRLQSDIVSVLFPLRNDRNQILATVKLRSASRTAFLLAQKEKFLLVVYLFLTASAILLFFMFFRRSSFAGRLKIWPALASLGVIVLVRGLLFLPSGLESLKVLPLFSPTIAGFFSWGRLTRSPGDIFITASCLFALFGALAFYAKKISAPRRQRSAAVALAVVLTLSAAGLFGIRILCERLVLHSSLNLLKMSLAGPFLLLHLSIALCASSGILVIFTLLKKISEFPVSPWLAIVIFFGIETAAFAAAGSKFSGPFILHVLALGSLTALAFVRRTAVKRGLIWLAVLLQVALVYGSLEESSSAKSRALIGDFLKNTILSQEDWARYIMTESFQEIDKLKDSLLAFLKRPETTPDPSRSLWGKTLAAKFNWYSALEIQDSRGATISRFSLNVPKIFRADIRRSVAMEWTLSRLSIPFMGKAKDVLVGHKDWISDGRVLGRTVLYISLDETLLPFLYSANPYFELLRVNSLPSLNEFDFRLAVFDLDGRLLFNPNKISTGISSDFLRSLGPEGGGHWTEFADKGAVYRLFAFLSGNRVYALFSPRETILQAAVDYFKLLVLYGALFVLPAYLLALLFAGKKARHPLRSFANRVYLSFVVVAVIPLFLFTFFSRNFFNRIFAQQFVEKAEILANTARSVMDDFVYFLQQEKSEVRIPPEDLMLWISTTIANDVNLYEEGRLVSSSRSEFFDAGLLPMLLDGEIYYRIYFENNPYYAQTQRIGKYSFQTLTIPYVTLGPRLMISLPFPFEQEEISAAARGLVEFFIYISVFFIATVLVLARGIGAMIVTPIHKLLAGTREASLGNLDFTLEYKGEDEMKTLIDGFNAMIKSLKDHQQELADLGKKAAWAEMARKVAHEIKNPLTPIQLSAEHLLRVYEDRRGDFDQALRESISYITGEVANLRRIAQEFLETSREPVSHESRLAFDELVRETVQPYKNLLEERIRFRESVEGDGFALSGDRAKLKIALRNLLTNAIESIRGKGEIRIRLARREGWLSLQIEDTGIGIERDILARIFEPYFSTKDVGTGLGLPIAKKIIEDHGGTIDIASEPGQGTRITLSFHADES